MAYEDDPRTGSGSAEDLGEVQQGRSADEAALSQYLSPREERPSSLLGALGGGGASRATSLLPLLMMSQMAQQRQPNYGDVFLNSFYGAQGMRNPNPTPQAQPLSMFQQYQMIHETMKDQALEKERTARLDLAGKANERLQAKAEADSRDKVERTARETGKFQFLESQKLLEHENPTLRQLGARGMVGAMRALNMPLTGEDETVMNAIATGNLEHKALKENLQDLANGVPPDVVVTRKGMTPELLAALQRPGGAVDLIAKDTAVERRIKAAQASNGEATLIEHQNPEFFKASPDVIPYIQGVARTKFGTTYDKLDDESKQLALKSGMVEARAAKMDEYRKQQQIAYDRQAQLARLHGNIQLDVAKAEGRGMFAPAFMDKTNVWVNGKTGQPIQGDDLLRTSEELAKRGNVPLNQKQVETQNGFQRAWAELANIKYTHEQMVKEGLYSGAGNWPKIPLVGPLSENIYKGTIAPKIAPTDKDRAILGNFEAQQTALINIDRQLGTLGVKAFGVYGPQLKTLSPTTGKEGVELTLSQIEDALRAQGAIQKLPGAYQQERIWEPPILGKGKTPPASAATAAPDLQKPPMSKMTFENAAARLRAQYPPAEAEGRILWLRQNNRVIE